MEKLNIACMVHNAYWYYVEKYASTLDANVDNFGSSTSYFYHRANLDEKTYDVLVLLSANQHSKMEESRLMGAIDAIREKEEKDITAAYLYALPEDKREGNKTDAVKIIKRTADGDVVKMYEVESNYDVLDLLNDALELHNKGLEVGTPLMKDLVNKEV